MATNRIKLHQGSVEDRAELKGERDLYDEIVSRQIMSKHTDAYDKSLDWGVSDDSYIRRDEIDVDKAFLDASLLHSLLGDAWASLRTPKKDSGLFIVIEAKSASAITDPTTGKPVKEIFLELRDQWRENSPLSSYVRDLCGCMEYQRIIGLGPAAVVLIMKELEKELDHWFWALGAITRANPVKDASRGNLAAMRDDWFAWWREHKDEWPGGAT